MFLRRNWQVVYAIVLITLVPLTIVLNTTFAVQRFTKTYQDSVRRTAMMVGRMFNVTSKETLEDQQLLQQRLEDVALALTEVQTLDVLAKEGEEFKVVASLNPDSIGQTAHSAQYAIAWYESLKNPGFGLATHTKSGRAAGIGPEDVLTADEIRSGSSYEKVAIPLRDSAGELKYLLIGKFSFRILNDSIANNLFWSYIWLIITVVIVVLLLAANTRLFEYAVLFRKLKEVDQMKDDFISMASHELRAPITAIRGYLSLFLEDAFGKMEDKPKSILKTTMAIATHLATLVEDLLEVSRIEQGRMSMNLEPIQVEEMVAEIVEQLHFEAEKKGLAFEYKKPETPLPKISADSSRLKQVLINLCSNGIKYTPKGSVIVTTIIKEGNLVEIKVTDTGLGMSAQAREKLFTKFYRVKTDDTRTIPGTGLGLWITKQIVELMRGKIFCDSIEKVGTQMSVLFPAMDEKALAAAMAEVAAEQAKKDAVMKTKQAERDAVIAKREAQDKEAAKKS